ncbi:MAG: type II secretion system protein [Phycisphaerales bacterium]|jgi:hypothetical protein|nr:type II secretion system protein [Phycisphaerales bacterium]
MQTRRAFALMDVIIGAAILGVGLAVVISMSSRSLSRQVEAEKQIVASWLADELLSMILVEGPDIYEKVHPQQGACDPPFEHFYYEIELEDDGELLPVHARATISWDAVGGKHSSVIETIIARRFGEPVPRIPAEPVDREARYWEEIEERESN